ncbi:MAG: sugar ABC transporter ATP-binding protein [Ancalomicrobiaceae bacterium]|nr:sugar ABC transporter ATP-binding protein [Ancalomicrobiaceae bacterium]
MNNLTLETGGGLPPPVLCMSGITKSFAGIKALKGVDVALRGGEVHALLGENGAGKSTLVKILFGVFRCDEGTIDLDGIGRVTISEPRDALAMGIGMVSQELSLVPQLTVAQNIFLGRTRGLGIVPRAAYRQAAAEILADLAPHLDVDASVGSLGMADRQLVEISRTLARGGRIIVFDEPTSSLTPNEQERLFAVIDRLRADGKAIVYISHRMKEIRQLCDRVTVLRDGVVVASGPIGGYSDQELNDLVAGRKLALEMGAARTSAKRDAPPLIEVKGLRTARVRHAEFAIGPGEILGFAGLTGAGRSAIFRALFGIDRIESGEIRISGRLTRLARPIDAMKAGIALIPEDRRGQAIVPMMDLVSNFGLGNHDRFTRFGVLTGRKRLHEIERYIDDMHIRPNTPNVEIRDLSGGNQQKVVIARWLANGARILLFDEPTRGIDVGAKAEIYALVRRLAAAGAAVAVISSELQELLVLSDRIAIVHSGSIKRVIDNDNSLTEEQLLGLAAGGGGCDG